MAKFPRNHNDNPSERQGGERMSEKIEGLKADVSKCALYGCDRIALLECMLVDKLEYFNHGDDSEINKGFCCKTHMLRYLQKIKMPRYSNKRMQRLATTMAMPLTQVMTEEDGMLHTTVMSTEVFEKGLEEGRKSIKKSLPK